MGVLQHGRFILRWCGTPFLTKRWIHNRLEIENRLVLGSKIILKNWAKRAAWGMWDIKPALYDNEVKNCLVATYGIQGLAEKHDFFGYLDVYFNYDSEGNYQIMDLQFEEYDPTATVTDSSTDGDETAENQADSVAGAAASYEQVIDEYRDMVQNHFYMDLQAKDRDGNIVHVFDNYEFGYRTNFDLCSGGLIEVTSSVSAAEYDVVFYRIGTDGASPVVEDVFRCVGTQTGNDTVSFQYTESGKEKKGRFYYNQKINCMRAEGFAEYNGKRYEFHPEKHFGTLDWGRGVWTYDNTWYWGSGNCDVDGHAFGFNIGYGFGNTKAASENVIFYDGVAHKIDDVTFVIPEDDYCKPWKFTSSDGRFEMDFMPLLDRSACLDYKLIVSDQHQVFGRMSGTTVLDDGTKVEIKDVLCFAEKVHNRY